MKYPKRAYPFRLYKAMVLDQIENKICVLWSYGGGEYFGKEFEDYLESKGIRHESSIIQPKMTEDTVNCLTAKHSACRVVAKIVQLGAEVNQRDNKANPPCG
ncbi:hypothetical protein DAPPUDRAFT_249693 [Daphnia pulex]|uniref:Integrase catalytic domain-containing protein n=1 Tax=Daphnia pulex TaxID=6669 RepID=E9GX44_DAPPU|nr:hypothetical protein DAPPUDRAFT_249693 [Daphnia pulex]|eukprot:EFX75927.1 hypothetical protein DAPPUDRAFT_249693 [Daphnia pulex]